MIDATIAGENANSYVTLAFADAYFADTLEAERWVHWGYGTKEAALEVATALIDSANGLMGEPMTPGCKECGRGGQALRFPTDGDLDSDGKPRIPDGIQYATCELALHVLTAEVMPGPGDAFPRRVRKLLHPFIDLSLSSAPEGDPNA